MITTILSGISIVSIIIVTTVLMFKQNEIQTDYNNKIKNVVSQVNTVNATGYNVLQNQESNLSNTNQNIANIRASYVTNEGLSKRVATASTNIGSDYEINKDPLTNNLNINMPPNKNSGFNIINGEQSKFRVDGETGKVLMENDVNISGNLKGNKIQLGNKFLLSGVGDSAADDSWLRFFNKDGTDYYGGVAAANLWSRDNSYLNGNTYINGNLNINGNRAIQNAGADGWWGPSTKQNDLVILNATSNLNGGNAPDNGITLAPWNGQGGLRAHGGGVDINGDTNVNGRIHTGKGDPNLGVWMFANGQDGAAYNNYQGGLESWYGIGFKNAIDGQTRFIHNTRTGDTSITGGFNAGSLGLGPNNQIGINQAGGDGWWNGISKSNDMIITNTTNDLKGGYAPNNGITLAPWNGQGGLRAHGGGVDINGTLSANSTVNMNNGWMNYPQNSTGINWGNAASQIFDNGDLHINTDDRMWMSAPNILSLQQGGGNTINFTPGWQGTTDGSTKNVSEIANDTNGFKELMIVGNRSGGAERRVGVWDTLNVNGTLNTSGTANMNNAVNMNNGWMNYPQNSTGINWGNAASQIFDNGNLHINTDDEMNISAPLRLNINTPVTNQQNNHILHTAGRQHINPDENLYLLPGAQTIIGKEWGGTGNLIVEGNTSLNGGTTVNSQMAVGDPSDNGIYAGATVHMRRQPANNTPVGLTMERIGQNTSHVYTNQANDVVFGNQNGSFYFNTQHPWNDMHGGGNQRLIVGNNGTVTVPGNLCIGPPTNQWCFNPNANGQWLDISRNGATDGVNNASYHLSQDGNLYLNRGTYPGWVADNLQTVNNRIK